MPLQCGIFMCTGTGKKYLLSVQNWLKRKYSRYIFYILVYKDTENERY